MLLVGGEKEEGIRARRETGREGRGRTRVAETLDALGEELG